MVPWRNGRFVSTEAAMRSFRRWRTFRWFEWGTLILVGSKTDPALGRPAVGRLGASIYVISVLFWGCPLPLPRRDPGP